jgi:hypothetical protein
MAQDIRIKAPSVRRAQAHGERVAHRPEFEWLARAGLVARGVVYGVVGVLAVKLAVGDGGGTASQQGAMKEIASQPFGKVLLILVAIGLFGYAAWRLTRAAIGHGPESSDDGQERVSGLASGLVYLGFFVSAVLILLGAGGGSGNPDKATGGVLGWPGGPWLVGLAGVVMIGVGLEQGRRAVVKKFCEWSKTEQMSLRMRKVFTAVGMFGHFARMVVFSLVGYFLIKAAVEFDPDKAVGLDGALAKLRDASSGPLLLGIVAAGLIGFACYSLLDSRYRKV